MSHYGYLKERKEAIYLSLLQIAGFKKNIFMNSSLKRDFIFLGASLKKRINCIKTLLEFKDF